MLLSNKHYSGDYTKSSTSQCEAKHTHTHTHTHTHKHDKEVRVATQMSTHSLKNKNALLMEVSTAQFIVLLDDWAAAKDALSLIIIFARSGNLVSLVQPF